MEIRELARRLGGDVAGWDRVRCPGPNRPPEDRSLLVKANGPSFTMVSNVGDSLRDCQAYIRQRLGLPDYAAFDDEGRRTDHVITYSDLPPHRRGRRS